MELIQKKISDVLLRYRATGIVHVFYALLIEALFIGYLYFVGFFTIETLLPTFVTVRFSLTTFFFILVLATMLASLLGRFLNVSFAWSITRTSPFLWIGILWGIGILLISLIKFPPLLILILALLFCIVGFLFWSIFAEEQ